ncbi:MAG: hypothetical protein R3223_09320, partial [Longimicrobiales bacterium]|nr:hypothetical protein [Longimicrobiales bacterium]
SGLLDIPVAAVVPHRGVVGSYSGFSLDVPEPPIIGPEGTVVGSEAPLSRWLSDGALTVGLWDRAEVGATFQSFSGEGSGGNVWGGFGRFLLLNPTELDGLGLAVGARWVTSPSFRGGDAEAVAEPSRLGFADGRLRSVYAGDTEGVNTNLSPYVVASALLPGFDLRFVPDHDFTFVLGHGGGMFSQGGHLPWYAAGRSDGWFYGAAAHVEIRNHFHLDLMAEHNGFEANLGAQLNMGGVRVGAFLLGSDYDGRASAYRSTKWGLSASVAICPDRGGLCRPELRDRNLPDTIQLPAPPPDTIVVEGEAPTASVGVLPDQELVLPDQELRYFSTTRFVALRAARAAPRAVPSFAQAYEPTRLYSSPFEWARAETMTTQESKTRTALAPMSSSERLPSVAISTARRTARAAARLSPSRV